MHVKNFILSIIHVQIYIDLIHSAHFAEHNCTISLNFEPPVLGLFSLAPLRPSHPLHGDNMPLR